MLGGNLAKHIRVTLEIGPKDKAEFDTIKTVDVVEQYPGTGSTDFWGISFAFSSIDRQSMSGDELQRELTLMQACIRSLPYERLDYTLYLKDIGLSQISIHEFTRL